ncbi:MAG: E2/UBC family protein, partial [Candidatus Doudnabacteria bacterium]
MRRSFQLPSADQEFLDSKYKFWETITEKNKTQWVIIQDFNIPAGYTLSVVSIALLIGASYPDVQIDMAYFLPALARRDGKSIRQLSFLELDGNQWQQWSRHRKNANDWQPDEDNI